MPRFATVCEPWRFETVARGRAVRGAVCQETELCGGRAVRGSPRDKPNRGAAVRSVRTTAVSETVVNTNCERYAEHVYDRNELPTALPRG